ncbi:MAG: TonB-dependent receptor plug domain-containing protein [Cellulophaga sp.]|nr:TonB-dependent receptor plug domain-containing protein [Cellulophaga sp.]
MKHLFLITATFLSFWTSTAQQNTQETITDSILDQNKPKITTTRLSSHTDTNKISTPLYIIDGEIVDKDSFYNINPSTIADLKVLKGAEILAVYGESAKYGVILMKTKGEQHIDTQIQYDNLPFTVYNVPTKNLNIQEDIYNALRASVPGIQITNTDVTRNQTPQITMRGDSNTIYIIDGVRFFDASILNTLNPNDIESIKVAPNAAAENFLRFNHN